MIAFLEGVVEEVREASLVVRAGAWGVEVLAPSGTLARARAGDVIRLRTHLVMKEDSVALYGFHDGDGLALFRLLLAVSSVGPKVALAVLSNLPTQVIASAVLNDDPALLSAAPGVGKRTAERIILELKTKMPDAMIAPAAAEGAVRRSAFSREGEDAVAALVALGYREANVKAAVAELAGDEPDAPAEALIRKALARLR